MGAIDNVPEDILAAQPQLPLKHSVLGILSLAATKGRTRVPVTEFYKVFSILVDDFSEMFPPIVFTRTSYSAYSKRLDDALQSLVGYSVQLPNPRLQYIETSEDAANRHLTWLREKHPLVYIERLEQFVDKFIGMLGPQPKS